MCEVGRKQMYTRRVFEGHQELALLQNIMYNVLRAYTIVAVLKLFRTKYMIMFVKFYENLTKLKK